MTDNFQAIKKINNIVNIVITNYTGLLLSEEVKHND